MKKIDISAYEVEEMSCQEITNTNGDGIGGIVRGLIKVLEVMGIAAVADDAYRGFKDGWQEAGKPEYDAVSGA